MTFPAMKRFYDWVKGSDLEDYEEEEPRKMYRDEMEEEDIPPYAGYTHEREYPQENYHTSSRASASGASRDNKVVSINHTTAQLAVVLVKPERFENAAEIADHLKDRRTVVLNLEQTSKDIARRLVDFLSGVAYANEGKIKKVANSTYIITPYNVDIMGDLIDELENNGVYI